MQRYIALSHRHYIQAVACSAKHSFVEKVKKDGKKNEKNDD
jgi:hypothetical protein